MQNYKMLVHGIGTKLVSNREKTCYIPKVNKFYAEKGYLC